MKFLVLALLAVGCGYGPRSSTHTVEGEATVKVVVGVDVSVCESMPEADKVECIKSLIELAKAVNEKKDEEQTDFGGIR